MALQPEPETLDGDDSSPSAGPATAPSPRASPGRRSWQLGLTVTALVLGLCGLAGAAAGVVTQLLPRAFTGAQQRQIVAWEMARRWRTTPAGKIFPADASYQLSGFALNAGSELALTAGRLGIARQTTCAAGTDAAAARVLDRLGCKAILRATYADSTSSLIVTVGVAVLPGGATARQAVRDLAAADGGRGGGLLPGLRPAAFPGTLAAHFGERQRQLNWDGSAGPYLIMSTVGYADGRPRVRVASDAYADQEISSLARGVAEAIRAPLGAPPAAPRCPGTPGC